MDDLLKAVAVQSANDATVCLAEYVAGSEEAFVQLMNQKAAELGMENTHFACCAGLDNEGHYSTARDIALMSRALLRYPKITDYTTIWMDTLRNGTTSLVNTNRLVRFYQGATGLKTGTTNGAGCCLSASASRDGLGLIAVVLGAGNSNDRFAAARALLDWGYANLAAVNITPPELEPLGCDPRYRSHSGADRPTARGRDRHPQGPAGGHDPNGEPGRKPGGPHCRRNRGRYCDRDGGGPNGGQLSGGNGRRRGAHDLRPGVPAAGPGTAGHGVRPLVKA